MSTSNTSKVSPNDTRTRAFANVTADTRTKSVLYIGE